MDMSLQDRLVAFVQQKMRDKGLILELKQLKEDSSIIRSGFFDSADLVDLAIWIEQEISPGDMDLGASDISKEWDTIANIVRFVEKHRSPVEEP
jgi:acyl carrier protein